MRGALGLIIYLAVVLFSSLIKKAAEEKIKRAKLAGELGQEPQLDTVEVFFQEDEPEGVLERGFGQETQDGEHEADYQADWEQEEDGWGAPKPTLEEDFGEEGQVAIARSKMAEAVIMSEVLRPPRAMRRWPSR
jgi:hypothetical protein